MKSHYIRRIGAATTVALLMASGATVAAPVPLASADAAPLPCTRVQPPLATSDRATDDAAGKVQGQSRRDAWDAAYPDRHRNPAYQYYNAGEGWRYGWTGGEMTYVRFLNRDGALLNGTAFAPDPLRCPGPRPVVVIAQGLTSAEVYYWWAGQALAEAGYVVLTFDYQGQGLSELMGHDAATGALLPPVCGGIGCPRGTEGVTGFLRDTQDALDFALATPDAPYAKARAGQPGDVAFPYFSQVDSEYVGLAGHSAGARVASVLQGQDPRVKAIVAWDNLAGDLKGDAGSSQSTCFAGGIGVDSVPAVPRVPALGQAAPNNVACMNAELKKAAYEHWRTAGVPTAELVLANTTHLNDWSPHPTNGAASNPWGTELEAQSTIAWFDRFVLGDRGALARIATAPYQLFDHYNGALTVTQAQALSAAYTSSISVPGQWQCDVVLNGCPSPS